MKKKFIFLIGETEKKKIVYMLCTHMLQTRPMRPSECNCLN